MTISVKIKNGLLKKINQISKDTSKDTSNYLNKALESYVEEQEDLKQAIFRLKDKDDPVISSKQFRKSLGL
jgi:RHH-type rel operon transcriptional repressor/antitoxin RelB